MPFSENRHAMAVAVGDRGILVEGPSGAGKTTLALALIARARAAGRHAAMVGDDQVMLHAVSGRLVCRPPAVIAGLVEVRGRAPQRVAHAPLAVVDLIVRLVPAEEAPRYAEAEVATVAGCAIPLLRLEQRCVETAAQAVESWLRIAAFSR